MPTAETDDASSVTVVVASTSAGSVWLHSAGRGRCRVRYPLRAIIPTPLLSWINGLVLGSIGPLVGHLFVFPQ